MRILIIDNTILPFSRGSSDIVQMVIDAYPAATAEVRRAPDQDLPKDWKRYDAWILSGSVTAALDESKWISHLDDFLEKGIQNQTAILGICYGHQALARVLMGRSHVGPGPIPEFGWTSIWKKTENSLLKNLPEKFYSYSSHFDEVKSLDDRFELLASSKACAIQGFHLKNSSVFGLQFHPERTAAHVIKYYPQMPERIKKHFQNFEKSEKVYRADVGSHIVKNFLTYVKTNNS